MLLPVFLQQAEKFFWAIPQHDLTLEALDIAKEHGRRGLSLLLKNLHEFPMLQRSFALFLCRPVNQGLEINFSVADRPHLRSAAMVEDGKTDECRQQQGLE